MNSHPDFEDGAPAGRDGTSPAAAPRRTSNAFGSPGTDSTVKRIDLNDALIRHPEATFVMRAAGDAMRDAGIADGDVLLVDRAITATHGAVVIAAVADELICRRLELPSRGRPAGTPRLAAADGATAAIVITAETPLEVWGVVTTVIKALAF
jgi:DNA polymerase V